MLLQIVHVFDRVHVRANVPVCLRVHVHVHVCAWPANFHKIFNFWLDWLQKIVNEIQGGVL